MRKKKENITNLTEYYYIFIYDIKNYIELYKIF